MNMTESKKKIIKRSILTATLLPLFGISLYKGYSIVQNYNQTKTWENHGLSSEIDTLPPSLAKNYTNVNDKSVIESLTKLNKAVADIEQNQGISKDKLESYEEIYQEVASITSTTSASDDITSMNERLRLYLDLEHAISDAYNKPNGTRLQELSGKLEKQLLTTRLDIDKTYQSRLEVISKDYEHLEIVSSDILNNLGEVENHVLRVATSTNSDITANITKNIETYDLTRFPHMKSIYSLLTSNKWKSVLDINNSILRQKKWLQAKEVLESLYKADYVAVSSFKTLEDVLRYDPNHKIVEKEGYTVDIPNSKVLFVYVDKIQLGKDDYFRIGSNVYFSIAYCHQPIPNEEKPVEKPEDKPSENIEVEKPIEKPNIPSIPNVPPTTDIPSIDDILNKG